MEHNHRFKDLSRTFVVATLSGGLAGLTVDVTLYPLDSFKTRLQSAAGFWASGGFSRPYAGISAVIVSSIPSAALFFAGYESSKHFLSNQRRNDKPMLPSFVVHMLSAGVGEVSACLVRVPCEVVKQRSQVGKGMKASSVWNLLRSTLASEGVLGLYRGFTATVARDVPFAFIQYPLWEILKVEVFPQNSFFYSALSGLIAGGFTAAVTTPLDVVKTRIMLTTRSGQASTSVLKTLRGLWQEGGARVLFSGIVPRVGWISCGGAIFLGSYDAFRQIIISHFNFTEQ